LLLSGVVAQGGCGEGALLTLNFGCRKIFFLMFARKCKIRGYEPHFGKIKELNFETHIIFSIGNLHSACRKIAVSVLPTFLAYDADVAATNLIILHLRQKTNLTRTMDVISLSLKPQSKLVIGPNTENISLGLIVIADVVLST